MKSIKITTLNYCVQTNWNPSFFSSLRLNVFPVVFCCLFKCQECSRSWDPCWASDVSSIVSDLLLWGNNIIIKTDQHFNEIWNTELPITAVDWLSSWTVKFKTHSLSNEVHQKEDENYTERIKENVPYVPLNLSHRAWMLLTKQLVLLFVPDKIRVKEKLNIARTSTLSSVLILLDLSAAPGTEDYQIILSTLHPVVKWHYSLCNYMVHILPATQNLLDHGNNSFYPKPPTGAPQGSVLHKISKVLTFHYFCYANASDD